MRLDGEEPERSRVPVGSTALQRAHGVKRQLQLGMRGKQHLTFLQTPLCPDGKGHAKAVREHLKALCLAGQSVKKKYRLQDDPAKSRGCV